MKMIIMKYVMLLKLTSNQIWFHPANKCVSFLQLNQLSLQLHAVPGLELALASLAKIVAKAYLI
jgi:uncharacterized membrane protein